MKTENPNRMPRLLGYLGLLPFIIPTMFLFCDYHHFMVWKNILISYAAVILSFLGAVYWGVAMIVKEMSIKKRNMMLSWSVIPSIVAWICLLIPQVYGFIFLSIFFVIIFTFKNITKIIQTILKMILGPKIKSHTYDNKNPQILPKLGS
jgi:hypothetical protein